jgi:hypothetical protein
MGPEEVLKPLLEKQSSRAGKSIRPQKTESKMFKILGTLFNIGFIAVLALVAGNLISVGDRTLSQHVENGLERLALKPMNVSSGIDAIKSLPNHAQDAAETVKRGWNGSQEGSGKTSTQTAHTAVSKISNPHQEKHGAAAQKSLQEMLQDLRESNERHKRDQARALNNE